MTQPEVTDLGTTDLRDSAVVEVDRSGLAPEIKVTINLSEGTAVHMAMTPTGAAWLGAKLVDSAVEADPEVMELGS